MEMEKEEESQEMDNLASKLLKSRTVVISQQVDAKLTSKVLSQLVLLEQEGNDQPITVFINSPGGEIFSGFAIFDMLNFISCPVTTIVTGFAASMGSILSLAADKGRRYAMPQAKIMIHQPLLMGYQGRATECEIQAREILKTRDHLVKLYSEQTGKSHEEIKKASHIFLPGVGAFKKAMGILEKNNLINLLRNLDFAKTNLLGICLGMQLLLENSEEDGFCEGLGLIKGNVKTDENVKAEERNLNRLHSQWSHSSLYQTINNIIKES